MLLYALMPMSGRPLVLDVPVIRIWLAVHAGVGPLRHEHKRCERRAVAAGRRASPARAPTRNVLVEHSPTRAAASNRHGGLSRLAPERWPVADRGWRRVKACSCRDNRVAPAEIGLCDLAASLEVEVRLVGVDRQAKAGPGERAGRRPRRVAWWLTYWQTVGPAMAGRQLKPLQGIGRARTVTFRGALSLLLVRASGAPSRLRLPLANRPVLRSRVGCAPSSDQAPLFG